MELEGPRHGSGRNFTAHVAGSVSPGSDGVRTGDARRETWDYLEETT